MAGVYAFILVTRDKNGGPIINKGKKKKEENGTSGAIQVKMGSRCFESSGLTRDTW